jgi:predicted dehydrogenase
MAAARLTWLLVGAGDIARKRVAAALGAAAGSQLVAVCSRSAANARSLAAEHQVSRVYTDLDEALATSTAEAVYIATPVHLHVEHAVRALAAGKHVLVEKPLGLTRQDCAAVIAAAARAGTTAGCAYYRRLYPAYRRTQELIAAGQLGRLVLGRLVCYSWWAPAADDPKRWRVVRAQGGGGPLADVASHMFDVLIGLLGMPVKVQARCASLVHEWDVEDTATVTLQMAAGAQISGAFAWSCGAWCHEFELVGNRARVRWQPFDSGKVVETVGRKSVELDLPPAANAHLPLVEDFVGAVRDGRRPACPLEEAARTNALLDAVYRSAATGAEVCL